MEFGAGGGLGASGASIRVNWPRSLNGEGIRQVRQLTTRMEGEMEMNTHPTSI